MKLEDKKKEKEPINIRENPIGVTGIGLRSEKPKKKIIYRKVRKQNALFTILAVFVVGAILFSWLSLGVQSRPPPQPELMGNDPSPETATQTSGFEPAPLPEKYLSDEPGISGFSSSTYHV